MKNIKVNNVKTIKTTTREQEKTKLESLVKNVNAQNVDKKVSKQLKLLFNYGKFLHVDFYNSHAAVPGIEINKKMRGYTPEWDMNYLLREENTSYLEMSPLEGDIIQLELDYQREVWIPWCELRDEIFPKERRDALSLMGDISQKTRHLLHHID